MLCEEARGKTPYDGRHASRRETSAVVGLIGKAGLVSPLDFCILALGTLDDRWIVRRQPRGDRRLGTFGRALDGPLRRKSPPLEIITHRLQRQPHFRLALDQVAHRLARP